jgi:hypothetical protein
MNIINLKSQPSHSGVKLDKTIEFPRKRRGDSKSCVGSSDRVLHLHGVVFFGKFTGCPIAPEQTQQVPLSP